MRGLTSGKPENARKAEMTDQIDRDGAVPGSASASPERDAFDASVAVSRGRRPTRMPASSLPDE